MRTRKAPESEKLLGLPDPQRKLYKLLFSFFEKHERFPTYKEMMNALGYASPCAVQNSMDELEKRGLISREYNRYGTLKIVGYRAVLQKIEEDTDAAEGD
jgi:SOS-response transcriptional repressor LexA